MENSRKGINHSEEKELTPLEEWKLYIGAIVRPQVSVCILIALLFMYINYIYDGRIDNNLRLVFDFFIAFFSGISSSVFMQKIERKRDQSKVQMRASGAIRNLDNIGERLINIIERIDAVENLDEVKNLVRLLKSDVVNAKSDWGDVIDLSKLDSFVEQYLENSQERNLLLIKSDISKEEKEKNKRELEEKDKKIKEIEAEFNEYKHQNNLSTFGSLNDMASRQKRQLAELINDLASLQNRPLAELIQENKRLKGRFQKESVDSVNQRLQSEIDQFISEFRYPEARNSIDVFLKTHENIEQRGLAELHYRKSLIYTAEINYQKAKEEIETAIALDREIPKIIIQYGSILNILGDYDKAITYLEDALKIRLKTLGGDHPDVADSYNNLGIVWGRKGDYDKAITYLEDALKIRLKTLGGDHPDVADSYDSLGIVWEHKDNHEKAIKYHEDALKIQLKTLGEDHPDVAKSYNNLGNVWHKKGDHDKAIKYHEKALKIRLKTLGEDHPDVADSYVNLGAAWGGKGDYDKAIKYFEDALKILHKTFPDGHPRIDSVEKKLRNVQKVKNT